MIIINLNKTNEVIMLRFFFFFEKTFIILLIIWKESIVPKVKIYALLMLIPIVSIVFWILTLIEAFKHTKTGGILLIFLLIPIVALIGWILILVANVPSETKPVHTNAQA